MRLNVLIKKAESYIALSFDYKTDHGQSVPSNPITQHVFFIMIIIKGALCSFGRCFNQKRKIVRVNFI